MIRIVKNSPKNQILSENISWAPIYPSQVIEAHFCVKNSYSFYFHQISKFWAVLPYELQKNLVFSDQYLLSWPIPPKTMILHIRKTLPNKINMKFGPPICPPVQILIFFSEIVH